MTVDHSVKQYINGKVRESRALESGHPAVLFLCTRAYKSLLNKLHLYYAIWPEGENWNWETIFYRHLHQLILQTTQYLDSWLSDLFTEFTEAVNETTLTA